MRGSRSGIGFVIRSPDSRFVMAGRSHLFDSMVPIVELKATRMAITNARLRLGAHRLMVEKGTLPWWLAGFEGNQRRWQCTHSFMTSDVWLRAVPRLTLDIFIMRPTVPLIGWSIISWSTPERLFRLIRWIYLYLFMMFFFLIFFYCIHTRWWLLYLIIYIYIL